MRGKDREHEPGREPDPTDVAGHIRVLVGGPHRERSACVRGDGDVDVAAPSSPSGVVGNRRLLASDELGLQLGRALQLGRRSAPRSG